MIYRKAEIIAEIGNSHDGSLGIAFSMVDMVKSVGLSCVKFQMHLADFESTKTDEFRKDFSVQDHSRFDYWNRVNFTDQGWLKLAKYCNSVGIEFLCTPFSIEAAQFLFNNNMVKRWKVGSGDALNWPLINYLCKTRLPLIISTGLIDQFEIRKLKTHLVNFKAWERTTLLHCVSMYPAPLSKLTLGFIDELKLLGCKVGFSDHSGELSSAIVALTKKIDLLEVHFTPNKLFFGPDSTSSLDYEQFKSLVKFNSQLEEIEMGNTSKNEIYQSLVETRRLFRKGMYWKSNYKRGEIFDEEMILARKPCTGIDVSDIYLYEGKMIKQDVIQGEPIRENDFL